MNTVSCSFQDEEAAKKGEEGTEKAEKEEKGEKSEEAEEKKAEEAEGDEKKAEEAEVEEKKAEEGKVKEKKDDAVAPLMEEGSSKEATPTPGDRCHRLVVLLCESEFNGR